MGLVRISAKQDPLAAPIFCHGADALGAGDGGFQFFEQGIRILRRNGNEQTAGSLGIVEHILFGKLRIAPVHPVLGELPRFRTASWSLASATPVAATFCPACTISVRPMKF